MLPIVTDHHSDYVIAVSDSASAAERTAAEELRQALTEISGARLPIRHDRAAGESRISISVDPSLAAETYTLRTEDRELSIVGGSPRGALYGVYALLREHLDCCWFTPDCSDLPLRASIEIPLLDVTQAPAYEYRNFILDGVEDPGWSARNGYNGFNSTPTAAHGQRRTHWQYGHSLHALLPKAEYFDRHPEYFDYTSRRKRVLDDYVNLCYTNDDVVGIVADNLCRTISDNLRAAEADPAVRAPDYYYLAQHDGGTPCTCPDCQAIIDDEGAFSAPLIHFCNRVIERVEPVYPDYPLITIAYRFSRRPPKRLRPHPNLIVQLCSIECCQAHPYATCDDPDNALFREDLAGWRDLAARLWVWDYMPRLWHPFLTGPGFETMAANFRWFHEQGVQGMFLQTGGERDFKWLNAWLMCQLMREPGADWRALRQRFMQAYYGAAAEPLLAFLAAVHDSVVQGNHHLHYKEGGIKSFFSDQVIAAGSRLFADAEAAVRDDELRLTRVREERMHFLCTKLQHDCLDSVRHHCRTDDGHYRFGRSPGLQQKVAEFVDWRRKRFGNAGANTCTMYLESDLVVLDNGDLQLEFVPRLAGRMVSCRHLASGRNLLHTAAADDGAFNLANGYREEWLAAPGPYEQEARCSWSSATSGRVRTTEGGADISVAGDDIRYSHQFEVGGKFMHPMQWERWYRLVDHGCVFHIESQIVNRGVHTESAAVATCLPLDLGRLRDITCQIDGGARLPLTTDLELTGAVLVLRNDALGLGLRLSVTGEIIASVRLVVQPKDNRLVYELRTTADQLTPGAGRRFCQLIEVLSC